MEQQDNILTQTIKEQVPVPVIGDDNKPAEPVKPVAPKIESEADIDARLTQMLKDEAKADKERDEKRLQRQMAARSLSDMGGVIIDLVKGSEGARVDPRHTEQHYQKLDDQTRKVYDAYRTRVDLLRKQQADRDKARIAQAAADERQRKELEARKELADQNDEYKRWKTQQDNEARIKVAQTRASSSVAVRGAGSNKVYTVPFAGTNYDIAAGAYDGRMGQLYAYLDNNNLFPAESGANDDLKAVAYLLGSSSQNSNAPESSKSKVATACLVAIHALAGNREHEDNIIAILNGTYNPSRKVVTQPAGGTQTPQSKTKKTITGVNGN